MNIINEEVIKAREVVCGYRQFNKETVESVNSYDPKLKVWTFKKINIDPKASEFKSKFIKLQKKEKNTSSKTVKRSKIKKEHIQKEKQSRPTGLKYQPRKKPTSYLEFDQTTLISKAYSYYIQGKSNEEISLLMNKSKRAIISMLRKRDSQLGIKVKKNDSYKNVVNLIKEGKTISEISKLLNICDHTISYHVKNYNAKKNAEEIESEYKEIILAIKRKSKINQVEYCYSTWISQANCRMESNLTTPARNKRCRELVNKGRLIEVIEGKSLRHGAMYKIPKNK